MIINVYIKKYHGGRKVGLKSFVEMDNRSNVVDIVVSHDVIYNIDEDFAKKGDFDVDPEKRFCQVVNHELYHASRGWLRSFLFSRWSWLMIVLYAAGGTSAALAVASFCTGYILAGLVLTLIYLSIVFARLDSEYHNAVEELKAREHEATELDGEMFKKVEAMPHA
jgi:hypothetical protein